MKKYPISIIIPVYKNYQMFYSYLQINKKYFEGCEVIIMNDFPGENITSTVEAIYKDAIVFNNEKNLGFAGNVNRGVMKANGDYVFLLNSDVVLKNNLFKNALKYFKKDHKIFAIAFVQIEKDGKVVGRNRGYFKNGFINHAHQPLTTSRQLLVPNFWAEGGSSMFNKKLFIKLGMLDELYNPFYWEDVDLSYRALKAGYKVFLDPSIKVEHHHESTIGKYFDNSKILKTAFRNQLIFQWKNITDKDLLLKHIASLPRHIITPGFIDAVFMFPKILNSRKKIVRLFIKSDQYILNNFLR